MCAYDTQPVKKKTGVGYKVFNVVDGKLYGQMFDTNHPRLIRRWLKATGGFHAYGAGWHIFATVKGAEAWGVGHGQVVRKVKYRKAFLTGNQAVGNVIIAKEIFILRGAK